MREHEKNRALVIGFIGAGKMARCLISGMLQNNWPHQQILVSCLEPVKHQDLGEQGIEVVNDNLQLVQCSDVIILACKPQQASLALVGLKGKLDKGCVISVAAGLPVAFLHKLLGDDVSIIRTMPNTPAILGLGVTAFYAEKEVVEKFGALCQTLFESIGEWVWIDDESLMDAVTATSGSGPAYVFLMAESMIKGAIELGLPEKIAEKLVIQTLYGAAHLLKNGVESPKTLRENVTSKGGTTQAALESFSEDQFEVIVKKALAAARDRGRVLGQIN